MEIVPDTANFIEERRQMKKRYPNERRFFAADLVAATEQIEGWTHADFMSNSRRANYVLARHRIMHICRYELNLSYSQIGRLLVRDHTTVCRGIERYTEKCLTHDAEIAKRAFIIARAESLFLNIPLDVDDANP